MSKNFLLNIVFLGRSFSYSLFSTFALSASFNYIKLHTKFMLTLFSLLLPHRLSFFRIRSTSPCFPYVLFSAIFPSSVMFTLQTLPGTALLSYQLACSGFLSPLYDSLSLAFNRWLVFYMYLSCVLNRLEDIHKSWTPLCREQSQSSETHLFIKLIGLVALYTPIWCLFIVTYRLV